MKINTLKRGKIGWLKLLAVAGIILFATQAAFAASVQIRTGAQANEGVYDGSNNPLDTGDIVQIIDAGANGQIDSPNLTNGNPGGDDTIAGTGVIGQGFLINPNGRFTIDVAVNPNQRIYVRAWNGSAVPPANEYGESIVITVPASVADGDFYNLGPGGGWGVVTATNAHAFDTSVPTLQPTITRSPTSLTPSCTEGQNASNQTFNVGNSGSATLNYTISDNQTWLSVSPGNESIAQGGAAITHTVSYTTSGLAAGTHNATITITDPNASNNPRTIPVTLTVTAIGQPTVTGINPNNGNQGATVPVTINGSNTNWTGGETITVTPPDGITVSNVGGSGTALTADFVIDGTAPQTARTVTVSGTQGNATFTVNGGGGGLTVTPNNAYIGQTIFVTGSGFGAAPGTITVGGVTANPTDWSDTSVTCAVPSGATSGNVVIGADDGAITIATGGVIIDDFEGGSVGHYGGAPLADSGYYTYGTGITPDTNSINADGPQASASSHGTRGMNILYSYASDWGGGWGAAVSNTLNLSAYTADNLTFYVNWDGSSNIIKLSLKDANDVVYAATVSNASLNQTGYHAIQVGASSFVWDADDPGNVAGSLDWSQIVSYGFSYPSQGTNANYQNIDSFYAGTVIFIDGPPIPTIEGDVIITQIIPPAGPAGTQFTGIGSGFGASQGQSVLVFENNSTNTSYQCDILSWSDTSIEAIVPRLAPAGNYTLKVIRIAIAQGTIQAFESNPAAFRVTSGSSSTGTATIYPNPFNPLETTVPATRASGLSGAHATIAYDATGVTSVGIYIYDMTAKLVYHDIVTGGQVTWDGTNMSGSHVADGLYILRVVNEENKSLISKGKILVIKQ